jgi:hypothetical protein
MLKGYAKLDDLIGIITMASGIMAKPTDLSLADMVDGTYVWTYLEECPLYPGADVQGNHQDLFQLDKFPGGSPSPDGGQAEGAGGRVGVSTMFVLCSNLVLCTPIPSIALFAHQDQRMQVATGKFPDCRWGRT